MIEINIQLAILSLLSLLVSIFSIIPTVLGYLLGSQYYSNHKFLAIPAYFTASSCLLQVLSHLAGLFYPYTLHYFIIISISNLILLSSGLYYCLERTKFMNTDYWSIEAAFISTWLFELLMSLMISFFSLGASWFAHSSMSYQPNTPSTSDPEQMFDSPMFLKPEEVNQGLGIPPFEEHLNGVHNGVNSVNSDAGNVDGGPHTPPLNMNLFETMRQSSWPSSLGSFHSVLDMTPKIPNNPQPNLNYTQSQPNLRNTRKSESSKFKFPKSPKKLNLTKSSFSLRKSPTKATFHSDSHHIRPSNSGTISNNSLGTLPNLDTFALGVPSGPPINSQMLMPNEEPMYKTWVLPLEDTGSRSVSGSSQLTGHIFPAAEYNKKINSAGFEREEPRPVLKPKKFGSQYELEKTRRFPK